MAKRYQRKVQPAVPALQWDGTQERLTEIQEQAAGRSHQIVSWTWTMQPGQIGMQILTESGEQAVGYGDWVLFTEDGLFVSRQDVFAKWYEEV